MQRRAVTLLVVWSVSSSSLSPVDGIGRRQWYTAFVPVGPRHGSSNQVEQPQAAAHVQPHGFGLFRWRRKRRQEPILLMSNNPEDDKGPPVPFFFATTKTTTSTPQPAQPAEDPVQEDPPVLLESLLAEEENEDLSFVAVEQQEVETTAVFSEEDEQNLVAASSSEEQEAVAPTTIEPQSTMLSQQEGETEAEAEMTHSIAASSSVAASEEEQGTPIQRETTTTPQPAEVPVQEEDPPILLESLLEEAEAVMAEEKEEELFSGVAVEQQEVETTPVISEEDQQNLVAASLSGEGEPVASTTIEAKERETEAGAEMTEAIAVSSVSVSREEEGTPIQEEPLSSPSSSISGGPVEATQLSLEEKTEKVDLPPPSTAPLETLAAADILGQATPPPQPEKRRKRRKASSKIVEAHEPGKGIIGSLFSFLSSPLDASYSSLYESARTPPKKKREPRKGPVDPGMAEVLDLLKESLEEDKSSNEVMELLEDLLLADEGDPAPTTTSNTESPVTPLLEDEAATIPDQDTNAELGKTQDELEVVRATGEASYDSLILEPPPPEDDVLVRVESSSVEEAEPVDVVTSQANVLQALETEPMAEEEVLLAQADDDDDGAADSFTPTIAFVDDAAAAAAGPRPLALEDVAPPFPSPSSFDGSRITAKGAMNSNMAPNHPLINDVSTAASGEGSYYNNHHNGASLEEEQEEEEPTVDDVTLDDILLDDVDTPLPERLMESNDDDSIAGSSFVIPPHAILKDAKAIVRKTPNEPTALIFDSSSDEDEAEDEDDEEEYFEEVPEMELEAFLEEEEEDMFDVSSDDELTSFAEPTLETFGPEPIPESTDDLTPIPAAATEIPQGDFQSAGVTEEQEGPGDLTRLEMPIGPAGVEPVVSVQDSPPTALSDDDDVTIQGGGPLLESPIPIVPEETPDVSSTTTSFVLPEPSQVTTEEPASPPPVSLESAADDPRSEAESEGSALIPPSEQEEEEEPLIPTLNEQQPVQAESLSPEMTMVAKPEDAREPASDAMDEAKSESEATFVAPQIGLAATPEGAKDPASEAAEESISDFETPETTAFVDPQFGSQTTHEDAKDIASEAVDEAISEVETPETTTFVEPQFGLMSSDQPGSRESQQNAEPDLATVATSELLMKGSGVKEEAESDGSTWAELLGSREGIEGSEQPSSSEIQQNAEPDLAMAEESTSEGSTSELSMKGSGVTEAESDGSTWAELLGSREGIESSEQPSSTEIQLNAEPDPAMVAESTSEGNQFPTSELLMKGSGIKEAESDGSTWAELLGSREGIDDAGSVVEEPSPRWAATELMRTSIELNDLGESSLSDARTDEASTPPLEQPLHASLSSDSHPELSSYSSEVDTRDAPDSIDPDQDTASRRNIEDLIQKKVDVSATSASGASQQIDAETKFTEEPDSTEFRPEEEPVLDLASKHKPAESLAGDVSTSSKTTIPQEEADPKPRILDLDPAVEPLAAEASVESSTAVEIEDPVVADATNPDETTDTVDRLGALETEEVAALAKTSDAAGPAIETAAAEPEEIVVAETVVEDESSRGPGQDTEALDSEEVSEITTPISGQAEALETQDEAVAKTHDETYQAMDSAAGQPGVLESEEGVAIDEVSESTSEEVKAMEVEEPKVADTAVATETTVDDESSDGVRWATQTFDTGESVLVESQISDEDADVSSEESDVSQTNDVLATETAVASPGEDTKELEVEEPVMVANPIPSEDAGGPDTQPDVLEIDTIVAADSQDEDQNTERQLEATDVLEIEEPVVAESVVAQHQDTGSASDPDAVEIDAQNTVQDDGVSEVEIMATSLEESSTSLDQAVEGTAQQSVDAEIGIEADMQSLLESGVGEAAAETGSGYELPNLHVTAEEDAPEDKSELAEELDIGVEATMQDFLLESVAGVESSTEDQSDAPQHRIGPFMGVSVPAETSANQHPAEQGNTGPFEEGDSSSAAHPENNVLEPEVVEPPAFWSGYRNKRPSFIGANLVEAEWTKSTSNDNAGVDQELGIGAEHNSLEDESTIGSESSIVKPIDMQQVQIGPFIGVSDPPVQDEATKSQGHSTDGSLPRSLAGPFVDASKLAGQEGVDQGQSIEGGLEGPAAGPFIGGFDPMDDEAVSESAAFGQSIHGTVEGPESGGTQPQTIFLEDLPIEEEPPKRKSGPRIWGQSPESPAASFIAPRQNDIETTNQHVFMNDPLAEVSSRPMSPYEETLAKAEALARNIQYWEEPEEDPPAPTSPSHDPDAAQRMESEQQLEHEATPEGQQWDIQSTAANFDHTHGILLDEEPTKYHDEDGTEGQFIEEAVGEYQQEQVEQVEQHLPQQDPTSTPPVLGMMPDSPFGRPPPQQRPPPPRHTQWGNNW